MALDPATDSHALQRIGILLLAIVAFFAGLARRLNVPYPILLVLAGLGISKGRRVSALCRLSLV